MVLAAISSGVAGYFCSLLSHDVGERPVSHRVPTSMANFFHQVSKYSGNVSHRQSIPSDSAVPGCLRLLPSIGLAILLYLGVRVRILLRSFPLRLLLLHDLMMVRVDCPSDLSVIVGMNVDKARRDDSVLCVNSIC